MPVSPIPAGYHSITPYLVIQGAAKAIEFYREAFDAVELMRLPSPDGKVGHAELQIGNSRIMLADEHPEMGFRSPTSLGGAGISMLLYVEDVDSNFPKALAAGGKQLRPLQNQFYGDRSGTFEDPFGHVWTIATHIEDLTNEEIAERMAKLAP